MKKKVVLIDVKYTIYLDRAAALLQLYVCNKHTVSVAYSTSKTKKKRNTFLLIKQLFINNNKKNKNKENNFKETSS